MGSLAQVKRAAVKIGAIVTDEKIGQAHSCEVESPAGFVWSASANHLFTDTAYQPWKPDYADLLARMSYGVEPCNDPECEWCSP